MKMSERCVSMRAFAILGALLLIFAPIAPRAWADPNADNPHVQSLLDQAQTQSYRLDRDANKMTGLIRSRVTWQVNADELVRVRGHVNDLGKLINDLESSRVDASPWQKEAIDRVVPLLREVAANTTDEIDWLNKNQDRLPSLRFDHWVNENAKTTQELSNLISDTVKYSNDRSQQAILQDQLNLKNTASR